ncbi:hypothetical protein Tco_0878407 [Tanacetum coccineum]|uniref:Uncharacterized protein n=1 Tax=Tanacetum coccineum TaxID=301880 RepID=A0ABQ5BXV5_9ASTR
MEYGNPDGIKLSVTCDALNRISGKHRALFLSVLGDMVREHIGLKILSWKKVDSEARDKLWDEITVKSTTAKMLRSKSVYQHIMGRVGYTLVKEKMKEIKENIKEGTLKVDHGTDAMTVVLEGMVTKLKNQLAAQGGQLQSMSTQLTPPNVYPVDINPINSNADKEGGTTVVGCENDASIQKSNGLATLEKEMETRVSNKTSPDETVKSARSKKMTRSIRQDSSRQDSQSQENVSPLLVLPQNSQRIARNNGFKTVKDAVGGFFAWPKDQVVFDPKATPPSTIQMNVENKTAPKLQTKRKNVYVSSDAMQRQAKKKITQNTYFFTLNKEEEGFVGKGGFGWEEDNIKDVVVVANDLCSSMTQTTLNVDFEEDINTKSHELMSV